MRAITVSVDYGDILAITLPRLACHFSEILVVTVERDAETQALVSQIENARLHVTDTFYRRGAAFNKGAALEEGFDVLGRSGWLAIVDADIIFPAQLRWQDILLERGSLYVPQRRILADPRQWREDLVWGELPLKYEPGQSPGYCQIFHADDPVLALRPWYQTDWIHAAGSDAMFERRWPRELKKRPPFEVLHLGEDGCNWFGRVTPRLDGTVLPEAGQRTIQIQALYRKRRSGHGPKYSGERLK